MQERKKERIMLLCVDFDGVLSSYAQIFEIHATGKPAIDLDIHSAHHIRLLKYAVDAIPNCKVVISSTWRLSRTIKQLEEHLKKCSKVEIPILDVTPCLRSSGGSRGNEILKWIEMHPEYHVIDWLALDDNKYNISPDHLLHVDSRSGLTGGNVIEIIRRFVPSFQFPVILF